MRGMTGGMRNLARRALGALPAPLAGLLRRARRAVLNLRPRAAVFRRIALENRWDGTESLSGPGSTLQATERLRAALPALLDRHEVRSVLDIPCGDAHWIGQALPPGIAYAGADIVPELIARNRQDKAHLGRFEVLDLVTDPLPPADLVLVRDCFIHLPNRTILQALANLRRSGARLLLTTTYPGRSDNPDIEIGGFRPIDLQRPPFGLPPPLETIPETEGATSGKAMGLWDLRTL